MLSIHEEMLLTRKITFHFESASEMCFISYPPVINQESLTAFTCSRAFGKWTLVCQHKFSATGSWAANDIKQLRQ